MSGGSWVQSPVWPSFLFNTNAVLFLSLTIMLNTGFLIPRLIPSTVEQMSCLTLMRLQIWFLYFSNMLTFIIGYMELEQLCSLSKMAQFLPDLGRIQKFSRYLIIDLVVNLHTLVKLHSMLASEFKNL